MYRIPGVISAPNTPAPPVLPVQPTRGPPPAPEDSSTTSAASITAGQAQDLERIAADLNDIVIDRLCAVGLDLRTALALLADHPASAKICHATDELDQAIRDIKDAVIKWPRRDCGAPENLGPEKIMT